MLSVLGAKEVEEEEVGRGCTVGGGGGGHRILHFHLLPFPDAFFLSLKSRFSTHLRSFPLLFFPCQTSSPGDCGLRSLWHTEPSLGHR